MADVSVSDLVQRVRDLLSDTGHRTSPYQTTSTTTSTATTVAVPDGTLWVQGDIGEWQTGTVGYEQFWVSAAPAGNNLTVVRGYNGTTAETHTSGDVVIQNPQFTGRAIQQALTQAVRDLWPQIYKTTDITITPAPTTSYWYDLNALTRGVIQAYQQFGSAVLEVGWYNGDARLGGRAIRYSEDLPAAVATSGHGVAFPSGMYDYAADIHVRDKRIITGTSDIPDDGELAVAECVVYLACARLFEGAELQRTGQGVNLEESGAIGAGSRLQSASYFRRIGKGKQDELENLLKRKYDPILTFWR